MKNIIKFILKMVVAALILVGAFFGIKWLTTPKTNPTELLKISNEVNIEQELEESYVSNGKNLSTYSGTTFNKYENESEKVSISAIKYCEQISNFLTEYYKYYINLTPYENDLDASKSRKSTLVKEMKELDKLIDETKKNVNSVADYASYDTSTGLEYNRRLILAGNSFVSQIEKLFEVDSNLRDYVYAVNYKSDKYTTVYEAQMEMLKDYYKIAFDSEIKGKIVSRDFDCALLDQITYTFKLPQIISPLIRENSSELKFYNVYYTIKTDYLNKFYSLTKAEMEEYVNSNVESNFGNETLQRDSLKTLYDYITTIGK